jgi:hypothetical protein
MTTLLLTNPAARTLDRHGAASRCLLRLWENQGRRALSDADYLRRYAPKFPHWRERPGELDAESLALIAPEFGFSASVEVTADYDAALRAHRYGYAIIAVTERTPLQEPPGDALRPHWMVLEQMDEDSFTVWCPFPSGASDLLPGAERVWWGRWRTRAYVLQPTLPRNP